MRSKPLFVIKRNLQKSAQTGLTFQDQINDKYLTDICEKITGQTDYECKYVENDYQDEILKKTCNLGRLATLRYGDYVHFITFSELNVEGRNSSVQSVPTAFNIFYMYPRRKKNIYYYFICKTGNPLTDYHMFIYRLMRTIGFQFLNFPGKQLPAKFINIEDMMRSRDKNKSSNGSNNSTYISKNEQGEYEAYCKTYGASKYESSLICYAMSCILASKKNSIKLYEILEGNLKQLPATSRNVLNKMGNVDIIPTDLTFEKNALKDSRGNSLRSPHYQFNLHSKLGEKHCALCGCNIPDIIQGAHIWPVASIKSTKSLTEEQMVKYATDGDNGLWLCENHHKLFDRNIIAITAKGEIKYKNTIAQSYIPYLRGMTSINELPAFYLNDNFSYYVEQRNKALDAEAYISI